MPGTHAELYWLRVSAAEPDPATLEEGVLWIDPGSDPPAINRWDGAAWEELGGTGGGVTDHGALTGLADDDHPQYTTTAEATVITGDAIDDHEAAADPHPDYLTTAEGATAIGSAVTTHEAAGDPHTGYQRESEKGGANGYASLDGSGLVPDAQLPAGLARDSEVSGSITTHEGAANPHPDYTTTAELASALGAYQVTSAKGAASGYASLDSGVLVPVAQLGSGSPTGSKYLRDDRTWQVPPGPAWVRLGVLTPTTASAVFGAGNTLTQAYTHLRIVAQLRLASGVNGVDLFGVRFNGDATNKYAWQVVYYLGATAYGGNSGALTSYGAVGYCSDALAGVPAGNFSHAVIEIPFYTNTTNGAKRAIAIGGAEYGTYGGGSNLSYEGVGIWGPAISGGLYPAITQVEVMNSLAANFAAGSIVELWAC